MDKDVISKKWNHLLQTPFPEISDINLQFELTEIDSCSAGCITRYLDGELNQECINILRETIPKLTNHLKVITGKEKSYFMLLHEIIVGIKELEGF